MRGGQRFSRIICARTVCAPVATTTPVASPLTHLALQKTELRLRRKLSPPGDDASSPRAWRAIGIASPLIGDASTAKSSDAWMMRT